jgi:hypothetical protein
MQPVANNTPATLKSEIDEFIGTSPLAEVRAAQTNRERAELQLSLFEVGNGA